MLTPLSSYGTQTDVFTPATTVSASAVTGASSNLSAGNIVRAVVGTIIGLALVVILVAFILVGFFFSTIVLVLNLFLFL